MDSHYITAHNLRIHVTTVGRGPGIVLVHGIGGPLMWQRLIPMLASRCTVHSVDLPGFGKSDAPERPATTDLYARILSTTLESLATEPVCVAGISYGGQVALACAHQHRSRIGKLVLISSTGLYRPEVLGSLLTFRAAMRTLAPIAARSQWILCRMGARSFFDIANRPPDLCKQFFAQLSLPGNRAAWLQCIMNLSNEQVLTRQHASQLHCPAMIIWGSNDTTVPRESAESFARLIPASRMLIYDHCAHSLPLEQPQRLASDILTFVNT